ncbi:uncharacterized mitochondrial protein-like protein [Tanacetum coccineum]
MDVKSAFLYGTIEEEVYVTQPPGFKDPDHPDKVYKVVKDYVYSKHPSIAMKEDGIFISQDKYVAEILKKFNYSDVKSASTLIDLEKPLVKDGDADDVDVHLYRSMIGSLMYLTTSRPDIMFAVCACARFQVTPKTSHLLAVKRIFRYLKGKPTLGLWYSRDSPFELVSYTDSDYAGATQDRKSTTEGCQFLGNMLISWQCKKQTVVATSTTEAEYVAAANCCRQVKHVEYLMLNASPFEVMFEKKVNGLDSQCLTFIHGLCINMDPHEFPHVYLLFSSVLAENFYCQENVNAAKMTWAPKHIKRGQDTKIPQSSGPPDKGSGPRCQDTILRDVNAQTRFEITSKQSIDPPLSRVLPVFVSVVKRMLILPVQVSAVEVNPVIYTSCIEQFWATAKVFKDGEVCGGSLFKNASRMRMSPNWSNQQENIWVRHLDYGDWEFDTQELPGRVSSTGSIDLGFCMFQHCSLAVNIFHACLFDTRVYEEQVLDELPLIVRRTSELRGKPGGSIEFDLRHRRSDKPELAWLKLAAWPGTHTLGFVMGRMMGVWFLSVENQ